MGSVSAIKINAEWPTIQPAAVPVKPDAPLTEDEREAKTKAAWSSFNDTGCLSQRQTVKGQRPAVYTIARKTEISEFGPDDLISQQDCCDTERTSSKYSKIPVYLVFNHF